MHVSVAHALASLVAGIGYQAVPGPIDTLRGGQPGRHLEDLTGECGIGQRDRRHVVVVLRRDDEDVNRRFRIDVAESKDSIGACHDVGRDVTCDDGAEQAVAHGVILARPQRSVDDSTIPAATVPAVEVRRTVGPSRAGSAPAAANDERS